MLAVTSDGNVIKVSENITGVSLIALMAEPDETGYSPHLAICFIKPASCQQMRDALKALEDYLNQTKGTDIHRYADLDLARSDTVSAYQRYQGGTGERREYVFAADTEKALLLRQIVELLGQLTIS